MAFLNRMFSSFCIRNRRIYQFNYTSLVNRTYSSFIGSKLYNPEDKIDFDISKNPEEWKYVTRLLPEKYIPDPVRKDFFPSRWKPPESSSNKGPYFVQRSRNHMVPVYLKITERGLRKLTYVRHIFGDIGLFSSDLKKYIEDRVKKDVGMRVDEVGCKVILRGDYVYYVEEFILKKGM